MLSIGLSIHSSFNKEDEATIRSIIGDADTPYPDFILHIDEDMKMVCTPEELKECLADAQKHGDHFETLYFSKVGGGAKLVKQATSRVVKMCVLTPPLFARSKKVAIVPRVPRHHVEEKSGSGMFVAGGVAFFVLLAIAVLYISRRRQRKAISN
jgi:hypothetical protein